MYRYFFLSMSLICLTFNFGCSDHYARLAYKSDISTGNCNGQTIKVDKVIDRRGDDDPLRYGTVRGGYGNPLKKLYTEKTISKDVNNMFEQALIKRGCIVDERSSFSLKPEVIILGADYLMRRDARCKFIYKLTADGKSIYENEAAKQNIEMTVGAGIFADIEHFKNYIDVTVSQCVDSVVDDQNLWKALKEYKPSSNTAKLSGKDRLNQLLEMMDSGLITKQEFESKKKEILESL
jgi:hypothetical protein